jgi:hypothetical protein
VCDQRFQVIARRLSGAAAHHGRRPPTRHGAGPLLFCMRHREQADKMNLCQCLRPLGVDNPRDAFRLGVLPCPSNYSAGDVTKCLRLSAVDCGSARKPYILANLILRS